MNIHVYLRHIYSDLRNTKKFYGKNQEESKLFTGICDCDFRVDMCHLMESCFEILKKQLIWCFINVGVLICVLLEIVTIVHISSVSCSLCTTFGLIFKGTATALDHNKT